MDYKIEKLLTEQKSVNDVNLDAESNLLLTNTTRPLHNNIINASVSQAEQADKERQKSTIYRFYGSIKPVISNPLYNDNRKIFYEKELIDNKVYVKNPLNILTSGVTSADIVEKDGWFGYIDDEVLESQEFNQVGGNSSSYDFNDNKSSLCQFIPFDPGYDRLNFIDSEGTPNYQLKITYPAYSRNDIKIVSNGSDYVSLNEGIAVISLTSTIIDGREYTIYETAINHGLRSGDFIKLYNFTDNTSNGSLALNQRQFKVFKLGDSVGHNKGVTFMLDIKLSEISFNLCKSSVKRVVDDVESKYYMRVFSAMTTEQTDYSLFPAAFSINTYGDKEAAFNFIKDVNIDPKIYRDNLGRPLTSVYLTMVKLRNDASNTIQSDYWNGITPSFWTDITPGFITNKHQKINYNVRAFNDTNYNQTYFGIINENDTEYEGDIVEYNTVELEERILTDVYHRFNTTYREHKSTYNSLKNDQKEGYIYKPHYRIKIRDFSTYIEEGPSATTYNIPDYAIVSYSSSTQGNIMKWRDFLDIGVYDEGGRGVEYPFESGAHYVFLSNRFYLKRQDPPCNYKYNDETYTLPADAEIVRKKMIDPKFIQTLSIKPTGQIPESDVYSINFNDPDTFPTTFEVVLRMWDYWGNYDLGERTVPGYCGDFGIIETNNIDDDC